MVSVAVCYLLILVKLFQDRCKLLEKIRSSAIYVLHLSGDYSTRVTIDEKELEVGTKADYPLSGMTAHERTDEQIWFLGWKLYLLSGKIWSWQMAYLSLSGEHAQVSTVVSWHHFLVRRISKSVNRNTNFLKFRMGIFHRQDLAGGFLVGKH